jgi:hypothetical protein
LVFLLSGNTGLEAIIISLAACLLLDIIGLSYKPESLRWNTPLLLGDSAAGSTLRG